MKEEHGDFIRRYAKEKEIKEAASLNQLDVYIRDLLDLTDAHDFPYKSYLAHFYL